MLKEYFKNLPVKAPKFTDKPTEEIIYVQLNIKLEHFKNELDSVLKIIKSRKVADLDKISLEVWKTRQFDDILLHL